MALIGHKEILRKRGIPTWKTGRSAANIYLCKMKFRRLFFPALIAALLVVVSGCSASRKIRAAGILGKCRLELVGFSLDSARIDVEKILGGETPGGLLPSPKTILLIQNIAKGNIPDSLGTLYFAIHLSVKNSAEDTLWLRSAKGSFLLDSLAAFPLDFDDSALALSPGASPVELHTHLQIGPKVLKMLSADTLRVKGDLEFSLSPDGEPIPFSIERKKAILPEERTALIDRARTEILSALTEAWTATLRR